MVIHHVVRGLVLLVFGVFGLPVIIALGMSLVSSSKTNFKAASHLIFTGLRALLYAIEDLADMIAETVAKRYPEQEKWLQPFLKAVITTVLVIGGLYFISILD